ncbi:MAG: hypothetical protein M3552_13845 [Planctomycetota bacterium]|nr:hypothetical protein [Planctomycetaceae bacterium]MDQ3331714.1 hypothetical protein [Planctomycetota bacterium]
MRTTVFVGSVLIFCATLGMRAADGPQDAETEQDAALPKTSDQYCVCPAYKMFVPVAAGTSFWYCTRAACVKDTNGDCTGTFACLGQPVGDYLPDTTTPGSCNSTCSSPNCRRTPFLLKSAAESPKENDKLPSGKLHYVPAKADLADFGFDYDKPGKNPHIKKAKKRDNTAGECEGVVKVPAIQENDDGSTTVVEIPLHLVAWTFKFDDGSKKDYGLGTEVVTAPADVPPVSHLVSINPMTTTDGEEIDRLYVVCAQLKNQSAPEFFIVRTDKQLKP